METGARRRLGAGFIAACLVVLAACGGGGGGSSAGGDGASQAKNAAPAPTGAVATKMQPQLNGWAFPNFPSATFPDLNFDTADLVSMFGAGPEVCVDGVADPCTLTAEAAAWARMVNQARATGHCEGLVALASARFNKAELPETVKLPSQEEEIRAVMRAFATQFVPEVQESIQKWTKASLAEKVDELKRSFASDKLEYTLGVYVESGGHAVLPYAVEYPTPDVARIMVYDSNWPGRNRYVDVDLANDKWSFSFAGDDPASDPNIWSGGAGDMDLTPFEAREGTCPFCGDETKVQSTTMLVRTDNLDWSVETPAGAVSPTQATNGDGAAARPIKGGVVITRLAPRATERSSYDFMITIPNEVLENGSSTSSSTAVDGEVALATPRLDAFISDGQRPKVASTTTIAAAPSTTVAASGSRAKLLFGGAASVFAVTPGGVAQFSTPGSKDTPVEVGARSIKSSDPNVDLTLASGNLVANASGPTVELGTEGGTLAVQVTTASGEVIQQEVTVDTPAVQVKADATGGVTVLEASSSGEVQKTEIASDGTKTQTVVDASALNLNKVEVQLPPALESKAIEALPKLEDRNLNNPNYKSDEAYTAPTTTVPTAAGAREIAAASTTSVPRGETPSTVQTRNAALPTTVAPGASTVTTVATRNAALPTTTVARAVTAAGATPTTVAAVVRPTLSGFRIATKTFGDDAFTLDPPDSNSPGGFRYSSSRTDVATVSATTGRVTIVGAGTTSITATQSAVRGFEAATISATLIVAKASPVNSDLRDITKTFGDDSFTIARPTSTSNGAFTFASSDEDVLKQSRTTGRWIIGGAGRATITITQAATDDFVAATDSFVVTVRKGTPTLTAPTDVSKAFLDADFDLPRPTSDSRGAFTYSSSDANVVNVSGTRASVRAAGTATITVSQATTTDWLAASTSFKVVVAQAAPTLADFPDVNKTFGDAAFDVTAPKSNSSGAITYSSSDTGVVTVGERDGRVSIIGAGTATVTASQAATTSFSAGSISAKVTVAKATPAIPSLLVADKTYGDADFTLKPSSSSPAAFSFATDKTDIFAVDAKTGLVKIIGTGTATLTARQEASANFESGSVAVSVTVKKAAPTFTWTLANKTFGDEAFDLTAPKSNSKGEFSYSVDDPTIATVSAAGRVNILKAGTVTITAKQVATDLYAADSTTAKLTIDKLAPTLTNFVIPAKKFGDSAFALTAPTSNSSGGFTYDIVAGTESNPNVATVTSAGQVTIGEAGTVQIRATQNATANYATASITATLTVGRIAQQGTLINGLVARWSFDSANTLGANAVGTGNLTETGGPTWTSAGKVGGAVSLNGSGAHLYLASGSITGLPVGNSSYTVSAWIKPSAFGARGIVGWGNYWNSRQTNAFRLDGSGGLFNYWWDVDLYANPRPNEISVNGPWAHVVATYDGTTRRIWVNGVVASSDTNRGAANVSCVASGCNFAIGKTVGNEWFAGLLDEITIYNRALDSSEITQLSAGVGAALSITSTAGTFGAPLSLTTIGGQGLGAISYRVVSAGTAGCSVTGSTLTATAGGSCVITATKEADRNYDASASADTTVTFNRISQSSPVVISTTTAIAGVNLALAASGGSGTGAMSFAVVSAGTAGCSISSGSLVTTASGSCSITATKAADSNFTSATSVATTITVSKQVPIIAPLVLADRFYLGAGFTVAAPNSTSSGTWTWASSNTSVASINSSTGSVTIGVPGTAIITATQATTPMHSSAAITAELKVLPATPTIGALSIPSKTFGDAPFTFSAPSSNSTGTLTYSSSDTSIATVNSATRTITIVGTGSTTITATQAATTNFATGSVTAVFVVNGVTPTLTTFGGDGGSGPGLKGTRYVGYFNDNVNWFATATKHGDTNQITNFTNFTSSADLYSWEWTGSFKASTSGTYTFCTNSDDASYLWLGPTAKVGFTTSNALINNGGLHGMREICNTTTLVGGTFYAIRIQFGENGGGDAIIVRFTPPGSGTTIYNGTGYYFGGMGLTRAEGDAPFTPTLPTSNSPGAITYSSSDTSVATIDANSGLVTVVGRGTTTLTATQAVNGTWASTSTSIDLRVLRRATVGSFALPTGVTFASAPFAPTPPTSNSPGAWSYESSNTAVAKWDPTASLLSVAAAGTATITAVQAETGEFAESRVSTMLTIAGETVVNIESGDRHTCGITDQSGVVCWGYNDFGQLGDGSRTTRSAPVAVTGLTSGVVKIATGFWHSCAVLSNGTVRCWGRNDWGMLGNGTNTASNTPVTVTGITNAVDIAASAHATCAILATGALTCWGHNGYGELANGTTTTSYVPVPVPSLTSGVTDVSGTETFYCATLESGAAKCWGRNDWGNLGDGTTTMRTTPVDVLGLTSGAVRITVLRHSACAVTGAGGVMCWGYGGNGQNGNGTGTQYLTPVQVTGITNALDVAGGYQHVCARLSTGAVRCWGWNGYGQLATGNTSNATVPSTVADLTDVRDISVGYGFSCALSVKGAVWCWGRNDGAELGDKTTTNRYSPVGVAGLKTSVTTDPETQLSAVTLSTQRFRVGDTGVAFAAASTNRTDAIAYTSTNPSVATVDATARTVSIVGTGVAYVKASLPATATQSAAVSYARVGVPTAEYVQVSAGYHSSCGLTAAGEVRCWGNGDWGQLGNSTTERRYAPTTVTDLGSGASSVAVGHHHACAVTSRGGVVCWGLNDYGQIGFGTTSVRPYVPVAVTGLSSGVVQVDAGYQHTCALTAAGGVKCWGYNGFGQLGDGTNESRTVPVDVVGLTSGVTQIDLGYEFSCALLENGTVRCWGRNDWRNLGDGTTTVRHTPRTVSGLSGAVAIAAGFHHACAVLNTGAVRCWGYNGNGQLGDGTVTDRSAPVTSTGLASGATRVVAGGQHTCALMSGGGVKCWGRNDSGELGDGTTTRRLVPTDVSGLTSGVFELSASNGYSTCAIVANDALKCWGFNDWGQIGNVVSGNVFSPTNVVDSFAGAGRTTTTLGALALPGSNYTTASPSFTLPVPTSSRTIGTLTCAQGGPCSVGDTGPGGGRVFHVSSGFAAPGAPCGSSCRYLEAAPITWAGTNDDPRVAWSGNTGTAIGTSARGTAIGSGFGNTQAIIAQSSTTSRAATMARAYNGGGLSDWYLPSIDELRQIYLKRDTIGSLSCGEWYQASTEFDAGSRWLQHPCQDSTAVTGKGDSRYVRPIRAFAPTSEATPISYVSSNPGVATVDARTGAVTITGAGTATLAASQGGLGAVRGAASRVTLAVEPSCADGGACVPPEVPPVGGSLTNCQLGISCSIGDTGPGGGKVFFIDTNDDYVGVDYLEAAVAGGTTSWCNTSAASTSLSGTSDNAQGIFNMPGILANCSSSAAHSARAFPGGGRTDWYLPAPVELQLVKTNLIDAGLLTGVSGEFWASNQVNATRAYTVDLTSGTRFDALKTDLRGIMPIRAFAAKGSVAINATLTGFALPASSYVFGTAPFSVTAPTSLNPAPTEYSSSNTSVATIDRYSGRVTIVGSGSTTFTATEPAYGAYLVKSQTVAFTVTKATPTLSGFTVPGGPYRADDPNFTVVAPTPSTTDAGAVGYTSSDPAVATIHPTTGVVDLLTAGVAVLTASVPGNANWNSGSVTYELTVGALCKDGGTCRIGDEGPGGGTVFFLDTSNQYPDLDFMEIAPADASSSATWCPYSAGSASTATGVGTGAANSSAMLAASASCAAAAAADGYATTTQTDWFLPSKSEFELAVSNLATAGITLPAGKYWTSSGAVTSAVGAGAPLPSTSGLAPVQGLGTTYVDMTTAGGGWKLVAYGESGAIGKLDTTNGTFNAATRSGSANLNALEAFRGADEVAISWTGASGTLPTGGIDSYANAVSFKLPIASLMTLTGTASTPPTGTSSTSFSIGGTSVDQSLVNLTTLVGSPGLPSSMYMRNKTFGVRYGSAYGLVSNPGINPQLDWNEDEQAFSAVYLGHDGSSGYVTPSGTASGYVPRTMAVWVRSSSAVYSDFNTANGSVGDTNPWTYYDIPSARSSATVLPNWQASGNEVIPHEAQWDNNKSYGNYPFVQRVTFPSFSAPGSTAFGGRPALLIHPDDSDSGVGVGWTNRTGSDIVVDIEGSLKLAYPTNNTDGISYHVQRGLVGDTNYSLISSGTIASGTTAETPFSGSKILVPSGESIYVIVGRNSVYYWDHTILKFDVTQSTRGAHVVTQAGSSSIAQIGLPAKVRAVRSWQRRSSCLDIKQTTNTNANGVYTINVNSGGVIIPTQAYCLMDSAMGGGGWTMIMKSAQNSTTFPYASNYWTTTNTLNEGSTNTTSADAKFSTFNRLAGTELLAIFPDVSTTSFGATERGSIDGHNYGWTWTANVPSGPKTALGLFGGANNQSLGDPFLFSGWNGSVFSAQGGFKWYGFNYTTSAPQLKTRWGFGWNNEGDQGSNDVSGGIGLDVSARSYSAGDVINCCQSQTGLNRSMAVQIFIR